WRHRRRSGDLVLVVGIVGSMLFSTFLHLDDLMILIVAAWLLLRLHNGWWTATAVGIMFVVSLQLYYNASPLWGSAFVAGELGGLILLWALPILQDDSGLQPLTSPELDQAAEAT
ncbi:MAG TPA: hypothetical protein VNI34_08370, partial [Candidatus Nitrosotalea sp.]|nr:hypothetical protein [Candidatus Nitrosotalea sp.]